MGGWNEERPRDPRVDDRVVELLSERAGRIAFSGLRRALGLHPEALTRALRRLEREGRVIHREDGYQLTERPHGPRPVPAARVVAEIALPAGTPREEILGRLAGRWFGDLRWVGLFEHPGDPWLVWSAGAGTGRVMLSVRGGTLKVLSEGASPEDRRLEAAAFELLARAVEPLRAVPGPGGRPAATFELGPAELLVAG
jgi:hypothetical protein